MRNLLISILLLSAGMMFSETSWIERFYVDDFGDPTTSGYYTLEDGVEGTFSNSASTNKMLFVYFMIPFDEDQVSFKLFEYGSNCVKSAKGAIYDGVIKLSDNSKISFSSFLYGDRFYIQGDDYPKVSKVLKDGEAIKVFIKGTGYSSGSSYLFSIDANSGM